MANEQTISSLILLSSTSTPLTIKKAIILNADSGLLKRIVSLVRSVIFGEIAIGELDRKQLSRYRSRVHSLASTKKSDLIQRKYLAQKVSIQVLTILLGAALPSIAKKREWEAAKEDETEDSQL